MFTIPPDLDFTRYKGDALPIFKVGTRESIIGFGAYLDSAEEPDTEGFLDRELKGVPKSAPMLENGAGVGTFTRKLLDRGYTKVYAGEPFEGARMQLEQACPEATVLPFGVRELVIPGDEKLMVRWDRHLYYHLEGWIPLMRAGVLMLAPGGKLVMTLKSESTDDHRMLHEYKLPKYRLGRAVASAFAGWDNVRLRRDVTTCWVKPKSEALALLAAAFMMWDRADHIYSPIPFKPWKKWVLRELFRKPWSHNHEHWIAELAV